jgi:hypothetical protein
LINAVDSQAVLLIAAIAVSLLLIRLVFRFLTVGLGLILTIVAITFGLQYIFGISPKALWFEISHLPQDLINLVQNL